MTRPLAQLNRFFVSPDFSVSYRRAKQLVWQSQASSGYALLTTLNGQLEYTLDGKPLSLGSSQSVVLQPNTSVTATGRQVELLFVTVSASLVLQDARAMHLMTPKSIVTFTREHVHGDKRLDSLLAEFVAEL